MSRISQKDLNTLFQQLRQIKTGIKCLNAATPPSVVLPGTDCDNPSYVKFCETPVDYDYKPIGLPICYECPDGTKYQSILCVKYENGVEVGRTTIFIGPDGQEIAALPACAALCVDKPPCEPKIGDWNGEDLIEEPFTNLQVMKKECALQCRVTLTTSAGVFTMYEGEGKLTLPKFNCGVTLDDIEITEGDCELSDIIGRWSHSGCNNC